MSGARLSFNCCVVKYKTWCQNYCVVFSSSMNGVGIWVLDILEFSLWHWKALR